MFSRLNTMVEKLGKRAVVTTESAGRLAVFLGHTLSRLWLFRFPLKETIKHLQFIGARTVPLILVSGLFTGMVVALQFLRYAHTIWLSLNC